LELILLGKLWIKGKDWVINGYTWNYYFWEERKGVVKKGFQ